VADGIEIVGEATNGVDALALLATVEADAALVDLQMPWMDGYRCLSEIRARHPRVATIVFSGTQDGEEMMRALEVGARGFIPKTTQPSDLGRRIREIVERRLPFDAATGRTPAVPSAP
jgi:two-component system response regulator DesR